MITKYLPLENIVPYMIKVLTLLTISLSFLSACSHAPIKVSNKNPEPTTKSNAFHLSIGMMRIASNIYVDPNMSVPQRTELLKTVKKSKESIHTFFGGTKSTPKIYACSTRKCFKKFGGVYANAKTINDDTVYLSNKGQNKTTITHELAHAEFNKRLGKSHWNKVPMWFDEGLAVLICKNPKYTHKVPSMPLNKLETHDQWLDAIRDDKPVYNIARQAMENWYNGVGSKGLHELIHRLKKGEKIAFDKTVKSVHQYTKL